MDDDLDFEEYEENEMDVNSLLYDNNDQSIEPNNVEEVQQSVHQNCFNDESNQIDHKSAHNSNHNKSDKDSNDGQNINKNVVNNQVIEERESPLPDMNQVEEVCDLNNSDSDWSDDLPEQQICPEVPIINSESANFKVVTEEPNSLPSLSSHESLASNRSDNNSDEFSNLVNFLENYDSMPDMESIVNKMDITMSETNTKAAKSLSNCSKTDKTIDNKIEKTIDKNTKVSESLTKSLSNNNKTDKTIDKNTKVAETQVKSPSIDNKTDKTNEKNTKVSESLTKASENLTKSLSNNKTNKIIDDKNTKAAKSLTIHNKINKTIDKNTKLAQTLAKSPSIDKKTIEKNTKTAESLSKSLSNNNKTDKTIDKNTKVAESLTKSLSNNNKTDKTIDKNAKVAESLAKTLSNNNKTDKTIDDKNTKSVKSISTHNKTNKTIDKNTKVSESLAKSPSIDNKTDSLNLITNQSFNNVESIVKTSISNPISESSTKLTMPSTSLMAMTPPRKTIDLDKKYYNSLRLYLTNGTVYGFEEMQFRVEAKKFKLKNEKLYFGTREVLESEEEQKKIAMEYHLNANGKGAKHRSIKSTVDSINRKYFWGTIEYDVKNVINHCRVCNPKDFDLFTFQLWKYIEVGVSVNDVLIVRDLSEKSSIFNCAVLDVMDAQNLSKHLISLFHKYGTPYAIRIVLAKESQTDFSQEFVEYLKEDLLEFIRDVKQISDTNNNINSMISLPMVDIKLEISAKNCPKNDEELLSTYFAIVEREDMSQLVVFSCEEWLMKNDVYDIIAKEIKSFTNNFEDWKNKLSVLSLHFQISGINMKANEVENDLSQETNTSSSKKSQSWKEVERLQITMRTTSKRSKKSAVEERSHNEIDLMATDLHLSDDSSDDDQSFVSSSHSISSVRKRHNSIEQKKSNKLTTQISRVPEITNENIEVIEIDDSSNSQPFVLTESQTLTNTVNYDIKGVCKPCVVVLKEVSDQFLDDSIRGKIKFNEEDVENENSTNDDPKATTSYLSSTDESEEEDVRNTRSKLTVSRLSKSQESVDEELTSSKPKTIKQSTRQKSLEVETPISRPKRKASQLSTSQDSNESKSSKKRTTFQRKISENKDSDEEEIRTNGFIGSNKKSKNVQLFNCNFCSYTSNDRQTLIMHTTKHRGENLQTKKVLCDVCCKQFYSNEQMLSHKEEEHPPEIKNTIVYGCPECKDETFFSINEIDEHLRQHIESLNYLKTPKYRCTLCKKFTATDQQTLFNHITQSHRHYKCAFNCPYLSNTFSDLERHAKLSHARYGKHFKCKYCDYDSACFGSLIAHKKQNHAIDWIEKEEKCCLCDETFSYDDSKAILDHLISHCNDFAFYECRCLKRCKRFDQMVSHCVTHHGSTEPQNLIKNLDELFKELIKLLKDRNDSRNRKQSTVTETQNAVAGLMEDDFESFGYEDESTDIAINNNKDALTSALEITFQDIKDESEAQLLSIPDGDENDFNNYFIAEDGQYYLINAENVQ